MRSVLVVCALALAAARVARAQSAPAGGEFSASFDYAAPAGCPTPDEVRALVVRRLGFDPFTDHAPRRVMVRIQPGARALEGRLEWRDAQGGWTGDQRFPAQTNDCAELARAMSFALAVQITLLTTGRLPPSDGAAPEPTAADDPPPPASLPPPPSGFTPGVPAEPSAASETAVTQRAARWTFGLGAGGSFAPGLGPGTVVLGRVFGSAARGRLTLELAAEVSSLSRGTRADGAGFTHRTLLAGAAGCVSETPFSGCVLARGGVSRASGQGVDEPASPIGAALQLGVRAAVRQQVGLVFFAQRAEGLVNVVRPRVTLDDIPVWTAPWLAATLGLDVGIIFQ